MIPSLLKCVSDFRLFFSLEKELFNWTHLLKILTFSVWNKVLKIWDTFFEIIKIEVQCRKIYFKIYSSQEPAAWITQETGRATPKIEKIYILNIYR